MSTRQETNMEPVLYSVLPWYKKLFIQLKNVFRVNILHYKGYRRILIVLGVIALFSFCLYLVVIINQVHVPIRDTYDKTGFVNSETYIENNGPETILANSNYQMTFNNLTTTFVLLDKTTGVEWRSNPDSTSARFLDTLVVYYSGSLGAPTSLSAYEDAVLFGDYSIRVVGDSLEVLYEIGGKKDVDRTDFPTVISAARMEELLLSQLEPGTTDYRRITEQAYVSGTVDGVEVWKLKDGIQTSILKQLYRIFYEVCGYTTDDLAYDLQENGIIFEDTYSYFEIAILYTITEDGLQVEIKNDSIYEKEKFPLAYIDVLPYFGAASTLDTGYAMIPDGSGVLIDFNNARAFALPYNQRIYGKELARIQKVKQTPSQIITLPLFGVKRNDSGFIAIAETGAEMAAILANVSSTDNPYNQAYYRFYFRESEVFQFSSIGSTINIVEWTDWYTTSDFQIDIKFVHEDFGSYNGMAKVYKQYLINEGVLTPKDDTDSVVLDLTLLGGYIIDKNFLGIPYKTVNTLTSCEEAENIIANLLSDGLTNINLLYKGWANDGLKPTYMGSIHYDSATGSKREFAALESYLASVGVKLFPEVYTNTAYTSKDIQKNQIAVRNVFGSVVGNYGYNEATLYADTSTRKYYVLSPLSYDETLRGVTKALTKIDVKNVVFADFGSRMYSDFAKKNTLFRTDTLEYFQAMMEKYRDDYDLFMFRNPSYFALAYANHLTDIPTYGTGYQIIGLSVPFYQLVISGYLDYSSKAFNLDDQYTYDWHKMKAIETASNLSICWSYKSTIDLVDTEYSYYYSTFYQNWYDQLIDTYQELNSLGIYGTNLTYHEILVIDGSVTKSAYANGLEIVFNYGVSNYDYLGTIVAANSYEVVKEAD